MFEILENNLNNIHKNNFGNGKYLIQTNSQAKTSGIRLLEVHGVGKSLDPNLRPEKQHTFPKQAKLERLQICQEEQDQKGRRWISSIKLSNSHQMCHRKFQEEPK